MTFAQFARLEGAIFTTGLLYLAVLLAALLAWGLTRLAIKAHRYERLCRAVGGDGPALALLLMLEADAVSRV